MRKVDKNYCMSSFLAFRYIIDDDIDFFDDVYHETMPLMLEDEKVLVSSAEEIEIEIEKQFESVKGKKLGILLSGGMDSACLASFMRGYDAYTFRFLGGKYQKEELERAEKFAEVSGLKLHYVDINWETVLAHLDSVMEHKGAPVHSIEPQIAHAAIQAKQDGIETMIIGDAADYVFGGMDGLHSKDWTYEEFKDRFIYVNPEQVLANAVDMNYAFEKYREGKMIDFISLMHEYTDRESYSSYDNAFRSAGMPYLDPYEVLKMAEPLDLKRVRSGESKYLIRDLFMRRYQDIPVPEKMPMPRPVDEYFKDWKGPNRCEFRKNLDMNSFSGNQKWLMWCLERFLNMHQ